MISQQRRDRRGSAGTLSSYVGGFEIGACLTLWWQGVAGGGNFEWLLWTLPILRTWQRP
ncbi:hypothetical protein DPMN_156045 [Dreissena polymorpha]|uniref:Uncharacterized protein n=1 Tax=Dreissena polymorpha TaxID=45954 RepID=A0A9D4JAH0_DREPO|nr:hypothetical protein DPMN_156045 [Dreissena polymorpha]